MKDAFYSLKSNKSPGYDDIYYNVIKKCFNSLCERLKYLFNLSVEKGVFADDLKIARVTPICKSEDCSDVSNYRPISVLLCFSKILECIIVYKKKCLVENDILYSKQFGFQNGHVTAKIGSFAD